MSSGQLLKDALTYIATAPRFKVGDRVRSVRYPSGGVFTVHSIQRRDGQWNLYCLTDKRTPGAFYASYEADMQLVKRA